MRGTRAKQLRRLNPEPTRRGPDPSPGIGRAELRRTRRDNRRTTVRTACAAIILGIDPRDRNLHRILLDPQHEWLTQISTRRLLGHVCRITADRNRRPA